LVFRGTLWRAVFFHAGTANWNLEQSIDLRPALFGSAAFFTLPTLSYLKSSTILSVACGGL
jgi:hypothetical protein